MKLTYDDFIRIENAYAIIEHQLGIAPEDEFDLDPVERDDIKIWAIFGYFYKANLMDGNIVKCYKKYAIHMYFGYCNSVQAFHVTDLGFWFPLEPKGVGTYEKDGDVK